MRELDDVPGFTGSRSIASSPSTRSWNRQDRPRHRLGESTAAKAEVEACRRRLREQADGQHA